MKRLHRRRRPVGYALVACLVAGFTYATYVALTGFGGRLTEVVIEIAPTRDGHFFIEQADLERRLAEGPYDIGIGHAVRDIPVQALERYLSDDPFVANAEVYLRFDGRLHVAVEQHEPILRVHDRRGADYYLSPAGEVLPLSKHAVARVPVLTGDVRPFARAARDTVPIEAFGLARLIAADELLAPLIEQIDLRRGAYTLVPKVGTGEFLLGDLRDLEGKLERLRGFILGVYPEKGWEHYGRIDLRYDKLAFGSRIGPSA